MVFQGKLIIVEVKTVEAIANVLPVHQVLGMKYHKSWNRVHGGTRQIVVVTHTDDIGITKLVVKQGIGKCAISIVGSPRRGLGRSVQSSASQQTCTP